MNRSMLGGRNRKKSLNPTNSSFTSRQRPAPFPGLTENSILPKKLFAVSY